MVQSLTELPTLAKVTGQRMDFGLDKLVELIEERFGRLAGTVVLAAIALSALAFAVHAVFAYLVVPTLRYAPSALGQFGIAWTRMTLADTIYAGVQGFIGLIAALVFFAVSRILYSRHVKKVQDGLRRSLQEVESITENCRAFTERNHAGLHAHALELEAACDELIQNTLAQANAMLADAAKRAGEPAPAPLSVQRIGPKLAAMRDTTDRMTIGPD